MRRFREFLRANDAYVFALALIAMPLMLGFVLIIIDVGRGNNLHTDLQNATDSLALAGARELDGGADSITRANTAIATLVNNQARFSDGGAVIIDESEVSTIYLDAVPPSDDTPINDEWIADHQTTDGVEADYVVVRSTPRGMTTIFPEVIAWATETINFQAEAVATYNASACEVTPLFICNPFEDETPSFRERFTSGDLYAREITMRGDANTGPGPGNFGFLRVGGQGAAVLGDALATNHPSQCYSTNNIETEPGGNWGQVEHGLNVRFDVYAGSYGNKKGNFAYRPAPNIRKGARDQNGNQECSSYVQETDNTLAMALPTGSVDRTFAGGTLHNSDYSLASYWSINHPGHSSVPDIPTTSYPGQGDVWPPSKYDIYKYEIEQSILGHPDEPNPTGHRAPNGERGSPQCYTGASQEDENPEDRRVIFAAVIDCGDADLSGQSPIEPAHIQGFLTMFLTRPMITDGPVKTISMEVVDFSGYEGNNTLDLSLREESVLVR